MTLNDKHFGSETVAILSGFLVGSTIAGLMLAVLGFVMHRQTKKFVEKLLDEVEASSAARKKGLLHVDSMRASGSGDGSGAAPPLPRQSPTARGGNADTAADPRATGATKEDTSDGYNGPVVGNIRLRSQSEFLRSQIGQQFVEEIEYGLEHGTFDQPEPEEDIEMHPREPEVAPAAFVNGNARHSAPAPHPQQEHQTTHAEEVDLSILGLDLDPTTTHSSATVPPIAASPQPHETAVSINELVDPDDLL